MVPAVPVISPRLLYVVESDDQLLRKSEPKPPIISNCCFNNPFLSNVITSVLASFYYTTSAC
jgi:hypothetical protein